MKVQTFYPYDIIVGGNCGPGLDLWQGPCPQRTSQYKTLASSGIEAPGRTLVIFRTPLFGPRSKDEGRSQWEGPYDSLQNRWYKSLFLAIWGQLSFPSPPGLTTGIHAFPWLWYLNHVSLVSLPREPGRRTM